MRFGLFGGRKIGRLNPLGDSHGYRDFIEYIEDANRLGIESLFVVEHHFTGVDQLAASLNLPAQRIWMRRKKTGVGATPTASESRVLHVARNREQHTTRTSWKAATPS